MGGVFGFDDSAVGWLVPALAGLLCGLLLALLYWKIAKPGKAEIAELERQIQAEKDSRPALLEMADRIAEERMAKRATDLAADKDAVIVDLRAKLAESTRRLDIAQRTVSEIRDRLECIDHAASSRRVAADEVIDLRAEVGPGTEPTRRSNPFPRPDRGFRRQPGSGEPT